MYLLHLIKDCVRVVLLVIQGLITWIKVVTYLIFPFKTFGFIFYFYFANNHVIFVTRLVSFSLTNFPVKF